jgi:hypothetical protein
MVLMKTRVGKNGPNNGPVAPLVDNNVLNDGYTNFLPHYILNSSRSATRVPT